MRSKKTNVDQDRLKTKDSIVDEHRPSQSFQGEGSSLSNVACYVGDNLLITWNRSCSALNTHSDFPCKVQFSQELGIGAMTHMVQSSSQSTTTILQDESLTLNRPQHKRMPCSLIRELPTKNDCIERSLEYHFVDKFLSLADFFSRSPSL